VRTVTPVEDTTFREYCTAHLETVVPPEELDVYCAMAKASIVADDQDEKFLQKQCVQLTYQMPKIEKCVRILQDFLDEYPAGSP
jgi:hypothetical protein